MRRAQEHCDGAIVNNQVEFHPLLDQSAVLATARDLGIAVSAYSPLARGAALKPHVIADIARRLGRPPSEVVLRWILQQGVVAIPMTTKRENVLSNIRALDFELSGGRHGRHLRHRHQAGPHHQPQLDGGPLGTVSNQPFTLSIASSGERKKPTPSSSQTAACTAVAGGVAASADASCPRLSPSPRES